jgi:hypothetical protein
MKSKFRKFLCVSTSVMSLAVTREPPFGRNAQPAQTQNSSRQHVLKDGTIVKLRLKEGLSSQLAQVGDRVAFTVTEDVRADDVLVIRKGSVARGTVTEARRKGLLRGGRLTINVDAVRLANGGEARLRLARMAVTGSSSAPFLGLAYQADVKPGEDMVGVIDEDFPIDPTKFGGNAPDQIEHSVPARAQSPTSEARVAPVDPPGEASTVAFKSTPDAAEIEVDGKFMGSTPSTLRISPGEHTISLEKNGFKSWQRTLTVTWGSIQTLDATLEKAQ